MTSYHQKNSQKTSFTVYDILSLLDIGGGTNKQHHHHQDIAVRKTIPPFIECKDNVTYKTHTISVPIW